jgi:uncharacterized membrane protein YozB (DUF420 family)
MTEILHKPGFFGTSANFAADMTLLLILVTAVLFTWGSILARRNSYLTHRWVQSFAVTLNAIMVLWMMILPFRDFVAPGLPARIAEGFFAVTTVHAGVGATALIFGVFVALRGNGLVPSFLQFDNYKGFMRVAYGLYMLATLLGIIVYIVWFVTNPNPPSY